MVTNREPIELLYENLPSDTKEMLDRAISSIVSTKKKTARSLLLPEAAPIFTRE